MLSVAENSCCNLVLSGAAADWARFKELTLIKRHHEKFTSCTVEGMELQWGQTSRNCVSALQATVLRVAGHSAAVCG